VRRSADKLPVKLDAVEKKRMAGADEVAKLLELEPHPSGCTGWFRQTFADPMSVDTPGGKRAASTAIYFLQRKGMRSAFHRQRSTEVFHHYIGAPLALYWIDSSGQMNKAVLGKDLAKGQRPQVVIPAEVWFAQRIEEGEKGDFCLTGVTVAPGWNLDDMDFSSTEDLVKLFPQQEHIIKEMGQQG